MASANHAAHSAPESVLDDVRATPFDQLGKEALTLSTGKMVHVGRLTLNQILAGARISTRTLGSASQEQIEAVNSGNWASLLTLIDDDNIEALLAIVLGSPGKGHAWLDELDLVDLGKIAESVSTHNDAGPLIKVFSGAVRKVSPPNSNPSSDQQV